MSKVMLQTIETEVASLSTRRERLREAFTDRVETSRPPVPIYRRCDGGVSRK